MGARGSLGAPLQRDEKRLLSSHWAPHFFKKTKRLQTLQPFYPPSLWRAAFDLNTQLIPHTRYRGRQPAASFQEVLGGIGVNIHHRRLTKESPKIDGFSGLFARDRNNPYGGRLIVEDTDRQFVGNNRANGLGRGVAWYSEHIKPY